MSSSRARRGVVRSTRNRNDYPNALDVSNGHNHRSIRINDASVNINQTDINGERPSISSSAYGNTNGQMNHLQLIQLLAIARHILSISDHEEHDGMPYMGNASRHLPPPQPTGTSRDHEEHDGIPYMGNSSRHGSGITHLRNTELDEELRRLQANLAGMDRLYQLLLNQSFNAHDSMNADANEHSGYPPASRDAIANLFTIQVEAKDLLENPECCINNNEYELGEDAVRLPCCGHLFRKPDLTTWLNKNCTCPTCRYEMPTDDSQFEVGRKVRMKHRTFRLRQRDLGGMSIQQLIHLEKELRDDNSICSEDKNTSDRESLVESIQNSNRVVIIGTLSSEFRNEHDLVTAISPSETIMNEETE